MDLRRKHSAAYVPVVLEESYARMVRYMGNNKVNIIYTSFLMSKKKTSAIFGRNSVKVCNCSFDRIEKRRHF